MNQKGVNVPKLCCAASVVFVVSYMNLWFSFVQLVVRSFMKMWDKCLLN